jgi:hypothetical protein
MRLGCVDVIAPQGRRRAKRVLGWFLWLRAGVCLASRMALVCFGFRRERDRERVSLVPRVLGWFRWLRAGVCLASQKVLA